MSSGVLKALVVIITTVVLCKGHNNVRSIAPAVNKFGDNLYKQLANRNGNIVFSPFSLHSVLALLTLGAGGSTRAGLLSQLCLPNTYVLQRGYSVVLEDYRNRVDQNPKISSAMFVSDYYSFRKTFKATANGFFHAVLQKVNFHRPNLAAAIINKWVANTTSQAISAVVNPASFNRQTAMLLLNAIYFKGQWNLKFDKSKTENNFVFNTPRGRVRCSMMVMTNVRHNVTFTPNFSYLELSFHNSNIKIAFISPYFSHSLSNLERRLDANTLFAERNNLRPVLLEIKVPKFKLNARYDFKWYLISIGMADIFDSPDLSYLFENPALARVDEVDQTTLVEINEDGATVASATKMQLVARSTKTARKIVLDRPFLFFIYDSKHNMILIRGRVENPMHGS